MMDRRDWMFTLAGLVAAPLNTSAQQPMPRIGVLSFGSPPGGANPDPNTGFRDGLRELGYVEGRNLVIEWRYADGRPERLAALAAELVQRKVALILAGGPASMHAARAATATIPIVAVGGSDPVGEGWAQSLARPGGNMTGLTVTFPELGPKNPQGRAPRGAADRAAEAFRTRRQPRRRPGDGHHAAKGVCVACRSGDRMTLRPKEPRSCSSD